MYFVKLEGRWFRLQGTDRKVKLLGVACTVVTYSIDIDDLELEEDTAEVTNMKPATKGKG